MLQYFIEITQFHNIFADDYIFLIAMSMDQLFSFFFSEEYSTQCPTSEDALGCLMALPDNSDVNIISGCCNEYIYSQIPTCEFIFYLCVYYQNT